MSNQVFHYSNTGISSGQRFYLKDDVSGIFLNKLNINSDSNIIANNLVYNTGDQTISGVKTFIGNHIISGNTTVSGSINISGNYDLYSQIENTKKLAIAYAIAL